VALRDPLTIFLLAGTLKNIETKFPIQTISPPDH